MRGSSPTRWLLGCLLASFLWVGCSTEAEPSGPSGTLTMNLVIGGDVEVDAVSYAITGNGITAINGVIDTSGPDGNVFLEVRRIPVGDDYLLELAATSADGLTTCGASEQFSVSDGIVTEIAMLLKCSTETPTGGLRVDGADSNFCPRLTQMTVSPLLEGEGFSVSALGIDSEAELVSYSWTASSGVFEDPTADSTNYTCYEIGTHELTVTVSDDDSGLCADSETISVDCAAVGLCAGVDCDDGIVCTIDSCVDGVCDRTINVGADCSDDTYVRICRSDSFCLIVGEVYTCDETGIRDAIAQGGGPHVFDCDGPTTVTTTSEIVIDQDVILDGRSNLTISGGGSHRVLSVLPGASAELRGFTVTEGIADGQAGQGGGIRNEGVLRLIDSVVTKNSARLGGGIESSGGIVLLQRSIVSGNFATIADVGQGGGIRGGSITLLDSLVTSNEAPFGGGIYTGSDVVLADSTVSSNSAVNLGRGASGGGMSIVGSGSLVMERSTVSNNRASEEAGGIRLLGDPDADNRIFNSTISGNRAGEDGGGIWLTGRNLLVVNSTFSENTSSRGGSAIHVCGQCNPNNLHLVNTIIGGTCSYNSFFGFPFGEGNIESPGDTCAFGSDNLTSVSFSELGLGPLRDNGGGTRTHLPGAGSVAIDRTPLPSCMVGFDQRGFSRPQGAGCDVGAVEVVP